MLIKTIIEQEQLMIGGKRHDLIPSIILLADTMTLPIVEFQVQKYNMYQFLPMNDFFSKRTLFYFRWNDDGSEKLEDQFIQ